MISAPAISSRSCRAGGGETMLLPFTAAVAPKVDIAAGRIVIDPPAEIEADKE